MDGGRGRGRVDSALVPPPNEAVIKLCASARGFLSKKVDPHKNVVIGEASDSNQIA